MAKAVSTLSESHPALPQAVLLLDGRDDLQGDGALRLRLWRHRTDQQQRQKKEKEEGLIRTADNVVRKMEG